MSRMIPRETVDVLRNFNDLSVDLYGIDCDLYIPSNVEAIDETNYFKTPQSDLTFKKYPNEKVWIIWGPNTFQLRKLGIFTEEEVPLLAVFKNVPEVIVNSYFVVPLEYIPNNVVKENGEFEVIERGVANMHDAAIRLIWRCAPRRVKGA